LGHIAEYGEGKYRIWADIIGAGDDLIVYVGGGDKPHIGSASIFEKGGKLLTISIPGHEDHIVSDEAAERITEATGRRCIVIVGIHVNSASKSEIKTLVENSTKCVKILLDKV
jgi:hypothetical protein